MRPGKVILNSLALVVISVSLLLLVNAYTVRAGLSSAPLAFESASPGGTYSVMVRELREARVLPYSHLSDPPGSPVEFSVYQNGRPLFEKMDIGDDSNYFADLFPDHSWVADSILRLGDKDPAELGHDEVEVTNSSRQVIAYLQVGTCKWEMFWLFDVRPGEIVKLAACPQTDRFAGLSWVSLYGMFAGGQGIPFTGENFKIRGRYSAPARYRITVSDDASKIESPVFEVYR